MCRAAVVGDDRFVVDDLNSVEPGPSYTFDTAAELKRRGWPSVSWMIGADMLLNLPKWHRAEELIREVDFRDRRQAGLDDGLVAPPAGVSILEGERGGSAADGYQRIRNPSPGSCRRVDRRLNPSGRCRVHCPTRTLSMTLVHDLPFDPTYGYTLETLLKVGVPKGPSDFEQFWRDTYAQTLAIPTEVEKRQIKPLEAHNDLYEIEYTSLAGRVGGWLSIPKNGNVTGSMVIGHGYGGRDQQGTFPHDETLAILCPCARGFHRSKQPDIPDTGGRHVLHGIESKETYIHRFNVAELWSAATVLLELFPHTKDRLFYNGCSFGGGLGAMMLPWDSRITRGFLEVPSFGNHPCA